MIGPQGSLWCVRKEGRARLTPMALEAYLLRVELA